MLQQLVSFFMSPCHMAYRGSGVRARAHLWLNLQSTWNFAWKLQPVMSDFHGQPSGREIDLCAGGLTRHFVINTELKFHQFTRRPDGVGLMPTSHDCEDDECVGGSAISSATVFVHVFRTYCIWGRAPSNTHVQLFVFISEVTTVWIGTYGTSVLSIVPWLP